MRYFVTPFIWISFLSTSMSFAAGLTSDEEKLLLSRANKTQICQYRLLKQLGWEFENGPMGPNSKKACEAANLEEAHAQNDLKVGVSIEDSATLDQFDRLLKSDSSFCAYKMKVGLAAQNASKKLSDNPRYRFFEIQNKYAILTHNWISKKKAIPTSFGQSFVQFATVAPGKLPSDCIESMYHDENATMCGVGLQLASYAMIYELFGKNDFNRCFQPDEIAIGDWNDIAYHNVFDFSQSARSYPQRLELGAQTLIGMSGYLYSVYRDRVINIAAISENFLIIQASQNSARSFLDGGIEKFTNLSRQVWELAKNLSPGERRQLLSTRDVSSCVHAEEIEQIRKILKNPMFAEVTVYAKDPKKNIMTLGEHIVGLLELNPDTPYGLYFMGEAINTGLYARYKQYYIDQCLLE